jgi:hypothetical protein
MVAAKEVFGQFYEASPPVQKSMQTLPTPVAKTAMAGLVAVTGAAGFMLTPSRKVAVNIVGGGLTALGGNLARKRLAGERQKAAIPAVAALLAEGLGNATPETLAAIAAEYDVPAKQFQSQLSELYLAFLNACLTSSAVTTSELSELLKVQGLLRLSATQAGSQVYAAARQLYSRHRAYLEDTEPNDSKRLLQKFVFLAERILSKDDSPEGYRYETLRLQKLFSLTANDWRGMAEEAAVPFYEKALNSAVIEAKPVTAEQLAAMRVSLGITDGCAEGMHEEIFSRSAGAMLESGRLDEASKARLVAVEALLGMAPEAAAEATRTLTTPLYATSFDEVIGEVSALETGDEERGYAQQSGKLALRQQELLLDTGDALELEKAALRGRAQSMLEEASRYMQAQNVPQALAAIQSLVSSCERLSAFMLSIGRLSNGADEALANLFGGLKGELKASESLALYRVLLMNFLEDLKIDAEEAVTLAKLRVLLGLSDAETSSVYQAAAGPLFRMAVQKAVGGELVEARKSELQASLADLALPAAVTTAISIEVYSERLREFTSGDKIMNEEQSADLATLRGFLSLDMAAVESVHQELCSPAYRKSVREVMGTTGIIPDEYWEGLATLRVRLGLSEESAKDLFGIEVTARMKTIATKAVDALEEKASGNTTEKMGMEASTFAMEMLNLVDFAVASKAIVTQEVDGQLVEVVGCNLRDEFSERTLKGMYKQFLTEAFSGEQAAQKEKIFNSLEKITLILGLADAEVAPIHNEIGSMVYRQYTARALAKGPLGVQETTFLESIKDALGMEQALCDQLVRDQQLNRVSVLLETMFEKDSVLPEDVRKMRDAADLYDVDLAADLQVSPLKLERLFQVELTDLVDSGVLTPEDLSALEEVCESLHVDEERATKMLEQTVLKRASSGVLQAAALLRQNAPEAAVEELASVLKYASMMEVQAECSVSAKERSELYMLYQASLLTSAGADSESKVQNEGQLELLKSVMGLAETAASA